MAEEPLPAVARKCWYPRGHPTRAEPRQLGRCTLPAAVMAHGRQQERDGMTTQ